VPGYAYTTVGPVSFSGTQFTCFTSTKVPILTQQPRSDAELDHELQDLRAELGKDVRVSLLALLVQRYKY
jgi:methionine salvage enolase-phosphatase E1